jgi:DNA-binding response OmpR family regulator/signal transduction histidine kinase
MVFKLLLVEDDAEIREIIIDYFTEKSSGAIVVDCAGTGYEGRGKCLEKEYDLVLLDVMLPEIDGFVICRELRKVSDVPIIFITAKHHENDRLQGYRLGCDDYIVKPFLLAELYAKVMALLKRAKGMVRNEVMVAGSIKLDPYRYAVFVNEKEITLAPMEFAILKILMENRGKVVDRENLLIRLWGYDFEGNERVVDNHIKKLRKALGVASQQIKTVFKRGYRTGFLTFRYYLPLPYQNSIKVIDGEDYYSYFWTVVARDINIWKRCSTTLIFVWVSCLVTFFIVAFILSKQTHKTYMEREKLEKQRREMTGALAHDLKTPLSIISGYAQNLLENIHTEKREHYADQIRANVDRMDRIIRSLLEMIKIESDSVQIKLEDVSLGGACKKVISRYAQICKEKSITALLKGDAVIKADHVLIVRVINNFFINALDNTPAGGSIKMKIHDGIFEIYNSGSHLPEDKIDEVWLPFEKADTSRSSNKGTGLGLAISRTILELHGFSYGAKNSNGGVVFWFKFQ